MTEKDHHPLAEPSAGTVPGASAQTTKAWTFSTRGDPKTVLRLEADHPMPVFPPVFPARGGKVPKHLQNEEWVLVRVAYAALNPGTFFYIRMMPTCAHAVPAVPEMDFSGVVEDVWTPSLPPSDSKPDVAPAQQQQQQKQRRFAKGDPVIGFIPVSFGWPTGTGALAGHIALPARFVVRKPDGVTLREAGGLMLASLVARQVLIDAKVARGHRVLVNGASGGIGSFGVQMARNVVGKEGCVVAVCSERNAEMVKGFGADEVIDYLQHKSLAAELHRRYGEQPFDAVMDCVGIQELFVGSSGFLAEGGTYSSVGVRLESWSAGGAARAVWKMQLNALWPRAAWLGGTGRTWRCSTVMAPTTEDMEVVARMVGEGTIRTAVDSEWAFADAPDSYAVLESKRARGKILIKVDDDAE